MAFSRVTKIGDGVSTQFVVNFSLDYIDQAHITARVGTEVDGLGAPVYRAITFLSTNLLQIAGAPAGVGVKVLFERTVPKDKLIINYSNGDVLDEENLDTSQKQTLMAVQEVIDGRFSTLTQDLDFGGFKGVNSGVPNAANDLTTKAYVDERVGDLASIVGEIATVSAIAPQVEIVAGIADDVTDVAAIASAVSTVAANSALINGTASALYMVEDVFTGDGVDTTWTLSTAPVSEANVDVWVGGSIQKQTDYSLVGNTLVITPAVANGVQIIAKTRILLSANLVEDIRDEAAVFAAAANTAQTNAVAAKLAAEAAAAGIGNPTIALATDISNTLKSNGKGLWWDATASKYVHSWASPKNDTIDLRDLMDEHYGVGLWTGRTGIATGSDITPAMHIGLDRLRAAYGRGRILIPPGMWLAKTVISKAKLSGMVIEGIHSASSGIVSSAGGNLLEADGAAGYTGGAWRHLALFREDGYSSTCNAMTLSGDNTFQPDQFEIEGIYCTSIGTGFWTNCLFCNGQSRTAPQGLRVVSMRNLQLFRAGAGGGYALGLFNVVQGDLINVGTYAGTGLGMNVYIGGGGTLSTNTTQLTLDRLACGGELNLTNSTRVKLDGFCNNLAMAATADYYWGWIDAASSAGALGANSNLTIR